jgi:hypothetical protein
LGYIRIAGCGLAHGRTLNRWTGVSSFARARLSTVIPYDGRDENLSSY